MHQILDFTSERVFTLRRNGEVKFLLRGGFDVGLQIEEVGGGLEIDPAVVGVHNSFIPLRSEFVLPLRIRSRRC